MPKPTGFTAAEYPGLIEADCNACANEQLEAAGGWANTVGAFMGHPAVYSKCGNKRCPCAAHHDNECTGSNEPGQPGSMYPAFDPNRKPLTFEELRDRIEADLASDV